MKIAVDEHIPLMTVDSLSRWDMTFVTYAGRRTKACPTSCFGKWLSKSKGC